MKIELDALELARALALQWPNNPVGAPYVHGFADAIRVAIEITAEQLALHLAEPQRTEFIEGFLKEAGLIRVNCDCRPAWKAPWPKV